jgi:hypothetical protein
VQEGAAIRSGFSVKIARKWSAFSKENQFAGDISSVHKIRTGKVAAAYVKNL